MRKILFILFIFIALFFVSNTYATDENGIIVTDFSYGTQKWGQGASFYSDFDPSLATYIYNEAGGNAFTSGSVNMSDILGGKSLAVSVSTLNSTSITVRAEGLIAGIIWADIYTQVFTSATVAPELWPLLEWIEAVRVGLKVDTDVAGDVVDIAGSFYSQYMK